jgi:hypothetical protein
MRPFKRCILRRICGHSKIQHAPDRLGQPKMEHLDAISNLRPEQGHPERECLRSQGLLAECVPGQGGVQDFADLPRANEREPGEQSVHEGLPHERRSVRKDYAKN